MPCRKCKKEIPDGSKFCLHCGIAQERAQKKYEYERVTFYYDGKRHESTGKTLKEAHANAAEKRLALKAGTIGTSGSMTVSRWADEWLETYKEHSVGEGQRKNYELYLGIIKSSIGSMKLKDVKDVNLQRILNRRAAPDDETGKVKSKSDLTKLRAAMKALFKRARVSRLISYDPAEELVLPASKDGTHRSITENERKNILKIAETHYAGLWIKTMLYCGLRPGETRALDWRHIDFKKKLVRVEQAMKAATKRIDSPKTASGVRAIPIPDKLCSELMLARGGPYEPVFAQPTTSKRHTKASMQCLWGNFKRELDISMGAKLHRNQIIVSTLSPDLVPYCLRHTYGTDLQNAGVPINVAKYLMGHGNISVTANIYTHTTEAAIMDAADKINKYVTG